MTTADPPDAGRRLRTHVAPGGGPIGRAIHNAIWLIGGKGVGGLMSLVYLALATRGLGPEGFGRFALVLSYGQAVTNFVQFQSWQTVIRYGAGHLEAKRLRHFRRLVRFTTLLDVGASIVGAALAGAGVLLVGPWLGWSVDDQRLAALFGLSIAFGFRGTPVGVLRLFDRFDLAAYAETVLPSMRLVGALVAWQLRAGVVGFLMAWAIAQLVTTAMMWLAAFHEIRRHTVDAAASSTGDVTLDNLGIWRFAWTTNLSSSIQIAWQQLPVLLVGMMTGPVAAGGYRLAAQLSGALKQPALSLGRAIYPEFARLAVRGTRLLAPIVRRATAMGVAAGVGIVLLMLVAGRSLLHLIGGPSYGFALPYLLLLSLAAAIELSGFGLEPALIALGKPSAVLLVRALVATFYVALMVLLSKALGAIGAGIATAFASLLLWSAMAALSWRTLRRPSCAEADQALDGRLPSEGRGSCRGNERRSQVRDELSDLWPTERS